MKHILSARTRSVLARLATGRVLLAFDFDGTLAPIVTDRESAAMRAQTTSLFARLCELYPCAVISGRARDDVARRLGTAAVKHVVGNHGMEAGSGVATPAREVAFAREALARALASHRGIEIEDKVYSLAIHYRHAVRRTSAKRVIDGAVAALPYPMRVVPGICVTNVLPVAARNKGDMLMDLLEQELADLALYVGDDVTDEDVFVLDQRAKVISMRVGRTTKTAARFYLRDQTEIDRLLASIVDIRTNSSHDTRDSRNS